MSAFRNSHERTLWLLAFALDRRSPAKAAERAHARVMRLREAELQPDNDDAVAMLEEMQRDDR